MDYNLVPSTVTKFDIYGTIFLGKFRIIEKTGNKNDQRVNRGRVCNTLKKSELIDILWKLNIMPFKIQLTRTRKELIEYLKQNIFNIDDFSDDKLRFFFIWYNAGMINSKTRNRNQMCDILQNELSKMGRLFLL